MAGNPVSFSTLGLQGNRPEYAEAERTWRRDLEPTLAELELERRNTISTATSRTIKIAAVIVLGVVILAVLTRGAGLPFILIGGAILAAVGSSISWLPLMSMKSQTKQLVVGAAANAFGFRYQTLHPDLSGIDDWRSAGSWLRKHARLRGSGLRLGKQDTAPTAAFDILKESRLMPRFDDSEFEDLIEGERAGASFSLVECKLTEERGSGKNRRTVTTFQGLLFHIAYPDRFLGRTLIARRGWWKGLFGDRDLKKVDMVSRELEDRFSIYSNDQVEARALLTPDRMERLIALERHFRGGKLRGVFEGDHLSLALEADDQFEAGSIWKPLVDPARYIKTLEEMALVCDVIDGFLTRDWVKDRL